MADDYAKQQIINVFGIFVGIVAVIITVYFQIQDPMTGIIWVLGILAFVALYFIISYPIASLKTRFNQVKKNTNLILEMKKDLNNIKDKLDISERIANLEAKMSLLSKKGKRGQVDPRWIIIIIILVLLFLFLKSKGIF